MTAILWVELLIELGIGSCLAWWLVSQAGMTMILLWCLPLFLLFAVRIGLVLISAMLSMQWQHQPSLSAAVRVQWLWHETLALLRFCWLMLSELPATPLRSLNPAQPLVVLLHGVYCNRGIWRPVLRHLRAHSQCVFLAPNLVPVSASLEIQARGFACWLHTTLGERPNQPAQPLILVGYSMGGLIARICVEQQLIHIPIHKLICIATPHAGSRFANYIPGAVAQDLRIGSATLTRLSRIEAGTTPAIVNLYSKHDTLVVPSRSAHLLNARNETVEAIGHMSLLYSPQVQAMILRELASAQPTRATSQFESH